MAFAEDNLQIFCLAPPNRKAIQSLQAVQQNVSLKLTNKELTAMVRIRQKRDTSARFLNELISRPREIGARRNADVTIA